MKTCKFARTLLSVAFTLVLLMVSMPAKAEAAEDFLSQFPFENVIVGNTKYSDCVGKPTIIVVTSMSNRYSYSVYQLSLFNQVINQYNLKDKLQILFFIPDSDADEVISIFKDNEIKNISAYLGNSDEIIPFLSSIRKSLGDDNALITPRGYVYLSERGEATKFTYSVLRSELPSDIQTGLSMITGNRYNVLKFADGNRTDRATQIYYRDYYTENINSTIRTKATEIIAGKKDDYDKVLAIYDWVVENIYYDFDDVYGRTSNNKYDSATVLATKRSICEGYTNLTIDLIRSAGIPARKVIGYALGAGVNDSITEGRENHAWIEALVDGRWIALDTTWGSSNTWENGAISHSGGVQKDRAYFDTNTETFELTHQSYRYHPDGLGIPTPSNWAVSEVNRANTYNIVPDSINKEYQSDTTRAEFCSLAVTLYEMVNSPIAGRTVFEDTKDINVEKAAFIGVVSGMGDDKFDPNGKLTREQAAVMLSRLAAAVGKTLTVKAPAFSDNEAISLWAIDGVGQVQASNIMSGTGNNMFSPQQTYTKEQSIVTILRLYDAIK